jgi:hypothetical protein
LIEDDLSGMMDQIKGKLSLLNYEKEFCQTKGLKPINEAYFAISFNPSE